jgi:hypothetical protein
MEFMGSHLRFLIASIEDDVFISCKVELIISVAVIIICEVTVEPPNKGHFRTMCFVVCIEVVLFSEVQNV